MEFYKGLLPESEIEKQKKAPFLILDDGSVLEQRMFSGGTDDGSPIVGSIVATIIDVDDI